MIGPRGMKASTLTSPSRFLCRNMSRRSCSCSAATTAAGTTRRCTSWTARRSSGALARPSAAHRLQVREEGLAYVQRSSAAAQELLPRSTDSSGSSCVVACAPLVIDRPPCHPSCPPWSGRNGHTATLAGRKIFIIGGWLGSGPFAASDCHYLDTGGLHLVAADHVPEWVYGFQTGEP